MEFYVKLFIVLTFSFFSNLTFAQENNRSEPLNDEDLISAYIDLFNRYIALDCTDDIGNTNKALILNYQLYNDKYSHTNFFKDFVDSLRWVQQNNWVINDSALNLNQYYISGYYYTKLKEFEAIELFKQFFNINGSWNMESSLEEISAAVTILIERGYSVYFTSFSRFHISVPPK